MQVNRKKVARMMRDDNLLAIQPKRFVVTTNSKHKYEVHLNLASRMRLTGINQLWVADLTYVRLKEEFVYLAVILDGFSRKVVGWAVDRTLMSSHLTVVALERAVADRRPQAGLVHHSDSRASICEPGICGGIGQARHDCEHESAGESLRQRQLRKFYEDVEAGRNLRQQVR
jgi:transposase InsO family protein